MFYGYIAYSFFLELNPLALFFAQIWGSVSHARLHRGGDGEESAAGGLADASGRADFHHTQLCQVHQGQLIYIHSKAVEHTESWT